MRRVGMLSKPRGKQTELAIVTALETERMKLTVFEFDASDSYLNTDYDVDVGLDSRLLNPVDNIWRSSFSPLGGSI